MVFLALLVGAELDGLTNLQPSGGCDDRSYPYYFKLRCENCGETSAKTTCISLDEVVELSSGKGTANLVQKIDHVCTELEAALMFGHNKNNRKHDPCKFCAREGSIVMIPGQGTPLTSELSQKGEKACLMVFECRGCEPIEFAFGNGWKAESVHGTTFDIDLSEGEFDEYDETGGCPVSLSNLQSTFKVVKKQGSHGKTRYV